MERSHARCTVADVTEHQRTRLVVDISPELRRRLKAIAAQTDLTMKDLVLANLQRNLDEVQRSTMVGGAPAGQVEVAQQQIAETVRPHRAAAAEGSVADAEEADESARDAPSEIAHQVRVAVDRTLAEQRSMLEQALQKMQAVFREELARAQAEQAEVFRHQLDPFTRDWESEADSIYDDAE